MENKTLGHYQIQSELGRGGMGVVYKAHDPTLNRHVAIKVLSEALANDDSVVERFKREAKSMAALNDAHIIQIYYIGEEGGQPYFVMEFVEGESLSERLKREGKLSVEDARRIIRETCEGLALAHGRGVIHRDIKPGNLMLTTAGRVKIADFGIAMVQDFSKRLTNTGEFVGTPGYLSPEVCVGQPVDHRSDIFALGIVFFEMLTGDIPFTEVSPLGMMLEVVKAEIPDVRTMNAEVDERTCNILKRMIAKDPEQRYQSCEEIIADLSSNAPVAAPGEAEPAAGQPTSSFNQARTSAIQQMESIPELNSSAAQTMVSSPGQEMAPPTAPEAKKKSALLPAMVAVVLLLALGGSSLFLFRGAIFGDGEGSASRVSVATTADGLKEAARSQASGADEADTESGEDAAGDEPLISDRELEQEIRALSESRDKLAASGSEGADEEAATQAAADPAPATDRGETSRLAMADTASDASAETTPAARQATSSSGDEGAQADEQQAASEEPVQLAKVKEPEPRREPPARREPREPRVVVMAIGDRAIAGPVEQLLENALSNMPELVVMDEAFFPGIGSVADERGVDLPGLSELIQSNGADVLVLAQIDFLGETPLEYYGQYSTLYSVNLKVRNILLDERRPLGRGWQTKVDFTNLNADEKAREAITPYLDELTDALSKVKG